LIQPLAGILDRRNQNFRESVHAQRK
jgi:hypothetical protein